MRQFVPVLRATLMTLYAMSLTVLSAFAVNAQESQNEKFQRYSNLAHAVIYSWDSPIAPTNEQIEQMLSQADIHDDNTPLGIVMKHILALSHQGFDNAPATLPGQPVQTIQPEHWNYLRSLDAHRYAANRAYYIFLKAMIDYDGSTKRLEQSVPELQALKTEMLEVGDKQAVATVSMWLANELSETDPFKAKTEIEYALPHLSDFDQERRMETQLDPDHAHTWLAQFYKEFNIQSRVLYHARQDIAGARARGTLRTEYFGDAIFALNRMARYDEALSMAEEARFYAQSSDDPVQRVIANAYMLSVFTHRQQEGDRARIYQLATAGAETDAASLPEAWQMLPAIFHAVAMAIEGTEQEFEAAVAAYKAIIDQQLEASFYPKQIDLLNHYNLRRVYELRGEHAKALHHYEMYDRTMVAYNTESYGVSNSDGSDPLSKDIEFAHLRVTEAEKAEQALRLETERLRVIVAGLLAALLGVVAMWFWQRQRRTARLADTDSLTGALTRRAFYSALTKSTYDNAKACVVLIDLDHFKQVNDNYGHVVGDEVLSKVSRIIQTRIRKTDLLCRYGGEEFLLYLHNIDKAEAASLLGDIRQSLRTCDSWQSIPVRFNVTFSAGIIQVDKINDFDAIISACDAQLYSAKASGRACTRAVEFA